MPLARSEQGKAAASRRRGGRVFVDRLNGEVLEGLKEGEALVTGVRRETAAGRVRG
jgi:hypothetical protein